MSLGLHRVLLGGGRRRTGRNHTVKYAHLTWEARSESAALALRTGSALVSVHPESSFVETEDGWQLAVHRWRPHGSRACEPGAVVMLHGLATNRINLHPDEEHSVALSLARDGFDVFAIELRGAGLSRSTDSSVPRDWGFGDYAGKDLPAALTYIRHCIDGRPLHALGHSMGGMLLLQHEIYNPGSFASMVVVGTPFLKGLQLQPRERRLLGAIAKVAPETGPASLLPLRKVAGVAGHFSGMSNWFADGMVINGENTEPALLALMAQEGISDLPVRLLREFHERIHAGDAYHGPFKFEEMLDDVKCPSLILSGTVDNIAPVESVEKLARALGSNVLHYREMGVDNGCLANYGHVDLLVGKRAKLEVYPLIADFLRESLYTHA